MEKNVDTAELRRLLEPATPGLWKAEDGLEVRSADDWQIAEVMGGDDESAPNCHLIVALRNAAPALIDEIDALRAKLAESEAACAVLADAVKEAGRFGYWDDSTSKKTLMETADHAADVSAKALVNLPASVLSHMEEDAALRERLSVARAYIAKCPRCNGRGMRSVHCWKCDDSGEDHDNCPDDVPCEHESHALLAHLDAVRAKGGG